MPYRQEEIARIQERIVEADLHVSAQITRSEQMIEKGYDVTKAKELLRQMETILDHWHVRRQLILDALAQR
jgi:vacuolar-type H+-ATPase subunit E/Vma4